MITPESYSASNTEHAHQVALFMSLQPLYDKMPELRLLFAIPNGGLRDRITASRLKAEGVKAGVPDLMLPVSRGGYCGQFIELKRITSYKLGASGKRKIAKSKGTVQGNQTDWKEQLQWQGYCVDTCWGWEEAKDAVLRYLALIV